MVFVEYILSSVILHTFSNSEDFSNLHAVLTKVPNKNLINVGSGIRVVGAEKSPKINKRRACAYFRLQSKYTKDKFDCSQIKIFLWIFCKMQSDKYIWKCLLILLFTKNKAKKYLIHYEKCRLSVKMAIFH